MAEIITQRPNATFVVSLRSWCMMFAGCGFGPVGCSRMLRAGCRILQGMGRPGRWASRDGVIVLRCLPCTWQPQGRAWLAWATLGPQAAVDSLAFA